MNFLGVGAWELVAILLIMLVFAGPKRMIHWSYVLGTHVSKFRKIWSETVDLVQKEFDDAGLDIKLPKEPPTRKSLNKSLTESIKPMTKPIQDSIEEVKTDMNAVKEASDALNNTKPKPAAKAASDAKAAALAAAAKPPRPRASPAPKRASAPKETAEQPALGAWGGVTVSSPAAPSSNGNPRDLGTWSETARED